jgi:thiamine biosynthesis lipoprotein
MAANRVLVPTHFSAPPTLKNGAVAIHLNGSSMGTTWQVKLMHESTISNQNQQTLELKQGIQACLNQVVAQMSTWETESNISRFNHAPKNTWHVLPKEFFTVLDYALLIAQQTQGAFNPNIGRLTNLWGFGPTGKIAQAPTAAAIEEAVAHNHWCDIKIDKPQNKILQTGHIHLDLSSIAKGFGVDQVALYLQKQNIHHYLIEVGGELRGKGIKQDGQPWWVEFEQVQDVPAQMQANTIVALHELSIATSGDYRRFFVQDNTSYSHTIDPRTGKPITHGLASVTVLHPQCMIADALATAMNVMGLEQGLAYAKQLDIAALFVSRTEEGLEENMSPHFQRMLDA